MAVTVTKIAATPNMLRYKIDSSAEGGETADVTQAALIVDTAPGPLRDLLTSPLFQPSPGQGPNPNTWANLHTDARLTVSVCGYGAAAVAGAYLFTGSPNVLNFYVADTGSVILELQYENSLVR